MGTSATFIVTSFDQIETESTVVTSLVVGHAHIMKRYTGGLDGHSVTRFTSAFDETTGAGTYVAMESFEGRVDDRSGRFNFIHSASTEGTAERGHEFVMIVPYSGTNELTGIAGTGRLIVEHDGTHRLVLDYVFETTSSPQ